MKKKFAIVLTTALAIASFSINTQAAPFGWERVWIPCEYGWLGACQPGDDFACSFIDCR